MPTFPNTPYEALQVISHYPLDLLPPLPPTCSRPMPQILHSVDESQSAHHLAQFSPVNPNYLEDRIVFDLSRTPTTWDFIKLLVHYRNTLPHLDLQFLITYANLEDQF